MKTLIITFFYIIVLSLFTVMSAGAEDIAVTEGFAYSDWGETTYLEISVPVIHGLADESLQAELNESFMKRAEEIQAQYAAELEEFVNSDDPEMSAHFGYMYKYEILYENDERMVFYIIDYWGAGSSFAYNRYFTIDKKSGEILRLKDFFNLEDHVDAIAAGLREQMIEANKNDGMYWIEGDLIEIAVAAVEATNHWYLNDTDDFVFCFDKYEVGPGAIGTSTWVIQPEWIQSAE